MRGSANVKSIDALKQFRGSLGTFAEQASLSLDESLGEAQRTLHWLREDCYRYWKKQAFERHEEHVQAKLNLKRKKIMDRTLQGSPSSCIDERKALKKAEVRLEIAERKLARTRYWIQQLDRDALDFKGVIQGLRSAVDAELPKARARLDNMIQSLEAYVRLAPPVTSEAVPGLGPEQDAAVTAESTVRSPTEPLLGLIERIRRLRRSTPGPDTRDTLSPCNTNLQGLSDIKPLQGLLAAIDACAPDKFHAQGKVLVRLDPDQVNGIYCERGPAGPGDSGWTIGTTEQNGVADTLAVSAADLLAACPALEAILNLPQGYFVLLDTSAQVQALVDAHDSLLWSAQVGGRDR